MRDGGKNLIINIKTHKFIFKTLNLMFRHELLYILLSLLLSSLYTDQVYDFLYIFIYGFSHIESRKKENNTKNLNNKGMLIAQKIYCMCNALSSVMQFGLGLWGSQNTCIVILTVFLTQFLID